MKYHTTLIEATLLRRPISFLVEAVLPSKKLIMLRCPNLGPLTGCDILGTQLWFSAPTDNNYLPTLELVEVNGGFLVSINQEILIDLATEAIQEGFIKELHGHTPIGGLIDNEQSKDRIVNLLFSKNMYETCYICLEQVIAVNDNCEAIFTAHKHHSYASLEYLILKKNSGNRAILMYAVLHDGAIGLTIKDDLHHKYSNITARAINQGVELLAYKASVSIKEIKLNQQININLPFSLISSTK